MLHDDPLSVWLLYDEAPEFFEQGEGEASRPTLAARMIEAEHALAALEAVLAQPQNGKPRDLAGPLGAHGSTRMVRFGEAQRARAEKLYASLEQAPGVGREHALAAVLSLLGYTGDTASIPFFARVLAAPPAEDEPAAFSLERARLALSALAHTAILHKDGSALELVRKTASSDARTDVRSEAVLVLGRTIVDEGGPIDLDSARVIMKIAEDEPEFGPRFLARGYLAAAGVDMPEIAEDAVYAFEVERAGAKRTIELYANDSLDALAHAILDAFDWDHEHMYAFHMTGDPSDDRFELSPFDTGDEFGEEGDVPFDEHVHAHDHDHDHDHDEEPGDDEEDLDDDEDDEFDEEDEDLDDSDEPIEDDGEPDDIRLGHLGMPVGHRFVFIYNFGPDYRFDLRLATTDQKASEGVEYPNLADSNDVDAVQPMEEEAEE